MKTFADWNRMLCSSCQTENPERAVYCFNCGIRLGARCTECGAVNAVTVAHCPGCGAALALGRRPPPAAAGAPEEAPLPRPAGEPRPERAFAEERKVVTVLFADTKGSLSLIAGQDPETARSILGEAIRAAEDAIHRYGGTVTRVQGDGVMALFGAPAAQEEHAIRASFAALAMQRSMRERAGEIRKQHGVELQLRVGLATGEVIVHATRNDLSTNYDATGEAVYLAARMEQLAPAGSILMAHSAYRLAAEAIETRSLGRVPVRGLREALEIHEVLRPSAGWREFSRGWERPMAPFVNRQDELGGCLARLAQAATGKGQVVVVAGDPGCGKTRLVRECVVSEAGRTFLLFVVRAVSFTAQAGYQPIAEMLRSHFAIMEDESPAARRKRLSDALGGDAELQELIPALLALLGDTAPEPAWRALEPAERRRRIQRAFCALLVKLSRTNPVKLLVEDLQWLDEESQSCVEQLIRELPHERILLLATHRKEFEPRWPDLPNVHRFMLEALARQDCARLLDHLVGSGASTDPALSLLLDRTEGNPFFLEESVRTLEDEGVLVREGDAFRLSLPLASPQLPVSIRAVLATRIDRLPTEDKLILEAASVIGRHFPTALLLEVARLNKPRLERFLKRVQDAGLLQESLQFAEPTWSFRHALTHEAVYTGMLRQRRAELHAQVFNALAMLHGESNEQLAEQFAYHARHGSLWQQSIRWSMQAGVLAAARSANREALAHYEQALEAARQLPQEPDVLRKMIDACFAMRDPLFRLGRLAEVASHLASAEPLIRRIEDVGRLGQLHIFSSHINWLGGAYDAAMAASEEARRLALDSADRALGARAGFQRGLCYLARHELTALVREMDETCARVDEDDLRGKYGLDAALAALALSYRARGFAELGRFEEAERALTETWRRAALIKKPFTTIFAYLAEGYVADRRGEFDRAIASYEPAIALCDAAETPLMYVPAASFLGSAYAHAGRIEKAVPVLLKSVETADRMGFLCQQPLRLAWLAEALLAAGRPDETNMVAQRALQLAKSQQEAGAEATAEHILGTIVASIRPGDVAAARQHFERAIAIADRLEMRPLMARAGRCLGDLLARAAVEDRGAVHLATAAAAAHAMGLHDWAGPSAPAGSAAWDDAAPRNGSVDTSTR